MPTIRVNTCEALADVAGAYFSMMAAAAKTGSKRALLRLANETKDEIITRYFVGRRSFTTLYNRWANSGAGFYSKKGGPAPNAQIINQLGYQFQAPEVDVQRGGTPRFAKAFEIDATGVGRGGSVFDPSNTASVTLRNRAVGGFWYKPPIRAHRFSINSLGTQKFMLRVPTGRLMYNTGAATVAYGPRKLQMQRFAEGDEWNIPGTRKVMSMVPRPFMADFVQHIPRMFARAVLEEIDREMKRKNTLSSWERYRRGNYD